MGTIKGITVYEDQGELARTQCEATCTWIKTALKSKDDQSQGIQCSSHANHSDKHTSLAYVMDKSSRRIYHIQYGEGSNEFPRRPFGVK